MSNAKRSMLDEAYDLLKAKGESMLFSELFNKVAEILALTDEEKDNKIAQFYTNLSLDGRFVVLSDNYWDLRERVPFDKIKIDMNDAYNDLDDEDSEDKEKGIDEQTDENEDSDESSSFDDSFEKDDFDENKDDNY